MGVVAELHPEARLPLSPVGSGDANDLGGAEGREAVHQGDADVDFGGLAVGISCADAFSEGLEAEPVSATGSSEPARASWLRSGFVRGIRSSVSRTLDHSAGWRAGFRFGRRLPDSPLSRAARSCGSG